MTIWIDAQMSPAIAVWIMANFSVKALGVRDVGLRDAEDREIFLEARQQSAIVLTKDSDFILLQTELCAPPQIIWDNVRKHFKRGIEKNFERNFIGSDKTFRIGREFSGNKSEFLIC